MPTLNWIGKEAVANHDKEVPFRLLKKIQSASFGNSSQNLIIHGDNLEALKAIMPFYANKIKCIYIDPPYNTGNEKWVYNDKVNSPKIKKWLGKVVGREAEDLCRHDKWLCMMYPRLKLLYDLLNDKGTIFISIDDNEQALLKILLNEVFGEKNFITQFCWRKSDNQANIGNVANVKEYILCYAKNKNNTNFNKISLSERAIKEYRYKDSKGYFRRKNILDKSRGKKHYEIKTPNGTILNGPWMITKEEFNKLMNNDLIYWASNKMPYGKRYLDEKKGQIISDLLNIESGTNQQASVELKKFFKDRVFDFPKPHTLIKIFIQLATNQNDIVIDSFAGSGTTGQAVMDLNRDDNGNRKFILIEMEDKVAKDITAERIKRAITIYKYKDGFEFCELDKPLFNEKGQIDEECNFKQLSSYIYFTETQTNIDDKKIKNNFIGDFNGSEYYLLYTEKDKNVLNKSFLKQIDENENKKIIYADKCLIDEDTLNKYHIQFKQIPYEINIY